MSILHTKAQDSTVLSTIQQNPFLLVLIPIFFLLLSIFQANFRLSHIPGPFLAGFTNITRFSWVLSYRAHEIHTELHRQYGPVVRFGPNMVSVGDPKEIRTIYGIKQPWRKVSKGPNAMMVHQSGI